MRFVMLAEPGAVTATHVFVLEQRFRYVYPSPIRQLRHRLVVVPRPRHGPQHRIRYGHDTEGAAALTSVSTDPFGNHVLEVWAAEVEEAIEFSIRSEVATEDGGSGPWRERSSDRRWLEPTGLTAADARIEDAARHLAGGSPLDVAEGLCGWTHDAFTYGFGSTDVQTPASAALQIGRGVCQDYAHVMLAACRAAGVPARYVSGHLVGEGGSHAWVEVLVPRPDGGTDVVAFDPTHRRRTNGNYLTIAIGRDYADVAPTSGTFAGPSGGTLTATKRLQVA
jgi:transglutaminase-like putative cysteine protease